MKTSLLYTFLLLSAASYAADRPVVADSEILAVDGSQMKGHVAKISPEELLFDSPNFFSAAPLDLAQIVEVTLPPKTQQIGGDHVATVTLSNGDTLRGELTSVNDRSIGLHTWYGGDLTLRRSMVDRLEIQDLPGRIYSGPAGETDWQQTSTKKWEVEPNRLVSHGSGGISRTLKLPSKVSFAFDAAWRQTPRFHFYFCADGDGKERTKTFFDLNCQGRYVYLRKTRDGRLNSILGTADVREFGMNKQVHIEILDNRDTGAIRLLVNGRVIIDWADTDPTAKGGGGIHFINDDSSSLRISHIEVTEWDGTLESPGPVADEDGDAPPPEVKPDNNASQLPSRIRLRNNDEIDGETTSIENGMVKMKTTFGDVEIPVSRLRTFSLYKPEQRKDPAQYEIPRIYRDDIRAWFADGTHITFRLKDVKDGRIQAYGQAIGDASFDLSAFQKLEFNLYREGLENLRSQDRW